MLATISDVARLAGVSPSTASRVLRGQLTYVRDETRRRVVEAADDLKYRPNSIARSLRTSKTKTIGVVTDEIAGPLAPLMLKAIDEYSFEHGYSALVCGSSPSVHKQRKYFDVLVQRRVDGILFAASWANQVTEDLAPRDIPLIYAYSSPLNLNHMCVLPDDFGGAVMAVEHLISLGHKRIAFINGPAETGHKPAVDRLTGYVSALTRHGIRFDPVLVRGGGWEDPVSAMKIASDLLSLPQRPTAVFSANDVIAAGVIRACRERGIRVPEDLAVIGFDDRDIAQFLTPPLTTVRLPMREIGDTAARLLIDYLENGVPPDTTTFVSCELVVRESC